MGCGWLSKSQSEARLQMPTNQNSVT